MIIINTGFGAQLQQGLHRMCDESIFVQLWHRNLDRNDGIVIWI